MINLLEMTKRQTLVLSAITIALGLAVIVGLGVFVAAQSNAAKQSFGSKPMSINGTPVKSVTEQPVVETQRGEDGSVKQIGGTQTVTTYEPQTSQAKPAAPQQTTKQPLQSAPKQNPVGETVTGVVDTVRGVTYTLKDVVPGDPLSYVGTYGQCPFYENAGEKGCWPPSNLVCNADWSICTPR